MSEGGAAAGGAERFDGSCLCGAVRYRATGPLGKMGHCHCTDCQKAHSAAFATFVDVPLTRFAIVQGGDRLRRHTASSGARRSFCADCGSVLIWERDEYPDEVSVAAATFDTPLRVRPEYHIFVRSRVPWHEIRDDAVQFEARFGHRD